MNTGVFDKNGKEIRVGDVVKFRSSLFAVSGRGVVFLADDKKYYGKYYGKFMIKDTRKYPECRRRNEGRMYPLERENIVYTIITEKGADE